MRQVCSLICHALGSLFCQISYSGIEACALELWSGPKQFKTCVLVSLQAISVAKQTGRAADLFFLFYYSRVCLCNKFRVVLFVGYFSEQYRKLRSRN